MTDPVRVACPYCNSVVEAAPGERTACPRCGEAFDAAAAERLPDDTPVSRPSTPAPTGFLYSRAAILLSLGLSACVLVIGLGIIRPWEPRKVPRPETKLPVVVSPLGLSGLTYLPAETNVAVGFQPMPLLIHAAQTKTDPKKFLLEAGVPEAAVARLDQLGLPLDQIDHLVVGLGVSSRSDQVLPRVAACLKLTRPVADEAKFLARLKAEKNSQQSKGGRTVYSIQAGLPLLLTRVDELTYLVGLSAEDFAGLDQPKPVGGGHLPKELRDALTNRVSPASFVWAATDTDRWADKPLVKLLAANPTLKDRLAKLNTLRAVAGGLSLEPDPQLRLNLRLADAAEAAGVRDRLRKPFPAAEIDQDWATLQTAFDPKADGLRSFLTEFAGGS